MRAYVLLKVNARATEQLMRDLKSIDGVIEANVIHGPYDCLVEVNGKTFDGLNTIVGEIRQADGVNESVSCVVMQSWRRDSD